MNIGVISDTHRNLTCVSTIQAIFKDADIIIHLGDNTDDAEQISHYFSCPVISISGNCDFSNKIPNEILKTISDKKIFITHGNKYNVKYGINNLRYRAMELEADIVLFGHTHCSICECIDGIWYINPGSPSMPRDGHKSVAIIKINNGKIDAKIKKIQ